jgi:hypothetical protein
MHPRLSIVLGYVPQAKVYIHFSIQFFAISLEHRAKRILLRPALRDYGGQVEHSANNQSFFLGSLLKYRKAWGARSKELLKNQLLT